MDICDNEIRSKYFFTEKRRKRKIASRWCLAHHRMVASMSVTVIATNNTK